MPQRIERQRFLACLSDPSRFSLVTTLIEGPLCVTDLAMRVGLSQSCTTRHLQILEREGIVSGQRHGKRVIFGLEAGLLNGHPVMKWVLDRDGAGNEAETEGATGRTRSRRRANVATPSAEALVESVEVVSVVPLAHESGWVEEAGTTSDDEPPGSGDREPEREDLRPAPRSSMDDFLL